MNASISIDERSQEPIYRQIVVQVRGHVAAGRLAAGDELPSLRQLAGDLRVNLNTVALAYRELERQGVVRLRQGSRATVLAVNRVSLAPDAAAVTEIRASLERVRVAAILAGVALADLRQLAQEAFADLDD